MYASAREALHGLKDPWVLERVASVLLLEEFPTLQPTGGPGDRGRDAVAQNALWDEEAVVIQYSIERTWGQKLTAELARYEEDDTLPLRMLFVSSRPCQRKRLGELVGDAARDHGVQLEVRDQRWLEARLETVEFRALAERELRIRVARPRRLTAPAVYGQQLASRIPGFDAVLVGAEAMLGELTAAMDGDESIVMVSGDAGLGKTRLTVQALLGRAASVVPSAQPFDVAAVEELHPSRPEVVVVDDAHRSPDLSGLRPLLDDERWPGFKAVLIVRPGYERSVLVRAGLEDHAVRTAPVGRLERGQIDELVQADPWPVHPNALRGAIVDMAQGNPSVAHLACEAAHRGALITAGEGPLLRQYRDRLLVPDQLPALDQTLLVVTAALGALHPEAHSPVLDTVVGARSYEISAALDSLAERGVLLPGASGAYQVKPDRLASVLVADACFPPQGASRVPYRQIFDAADQRTRTSMVSTLADAVLFADGRGSDVLLNIIGPWPPSDNDASTWTQTLRRAVEVVHALPGPAGDLLDAFQVAWPPESSHGPYVDVHARDALVQAGELARGLARSDLRGGLWRLLSLAVLEGDVDGGGGRVQTPTSCIREVVGHAQPEWGEGVTLRGEELLDVIRAWRGTYPDDRAAAVTARAASGVIAVTFETSGMAAHDAMVFQFGTFRALRSERHERLVLDAATLVAEQLGQLNAVGLGEVIDRLAAVRRIAAGNDAGNGTTASPWGRGVMRAAAVTIRDALLARWNELPLALRRRLLDADGSVEFRRAARDDADLQAYLCFYPVSRGRAGRRALRDVELADRRARKLLRRTGTMDGIRLLADAAERPPGPGSTGMTIWRFARTVGASLADDQIDEAVTVLRRSPQAARHLADLLDAAGEHHPARVAVHVEELVRDPSGARYVARLLDAVAPEVEDALIEMLATSVDIDALFMFVEHLETCGRRDEGARAEWIVRVAEAQPDIARLAVPLAAFGGAGHQTMVVVPDAIADRFLDQLGRLLADPGFDDANGDPYLNPAFEEGCRLAGMQIVDLLAVRVRAILAEPSGRTVSYRTIPRALDEALVGLTVQERPDVLVRLAALLEEIDGADGRYRVDEALLGALARVGAGLEEYAALLDRWARGTPADRRRALDLLDNRYGSPLWERTARTLLATGIDDEEREWLLWAATDTAIGWGFRHAVHERRAVELATWMRDADPAVARFGRIASERLRAWAEDERQRERVAHDGYR